MDIAQKIATVLMAGDGRQIGKLGIFPSEEVCYILECFGLVQMQLVGCPLIMIAELILERVLLMAGLE